MTEFMSQTRLHEIARVSEHPTLSAGRLIPTLGWSLDAETGRPVGRWALREADGVPPACA